MQEGKWEEAASAYQEALREDPFNPATEAKLRAARRQAAAVYQERGREALKQRRLPEALENLQKAISIDPSNPEHQAAVAEVLRFKEAQERAAVGQKLLKGGRLQEAAEEFEKALELDPGQTVAQEGLMQLADRQRVANAPLSGSKQPITLRFQNARTREVFEALARSSGINVLFDKDLKDDPVTIFIKDASFEEALNLILTTQNLFMRRLSVDTILIIPKTKQKLDQYQDLIIRTFYLSTAKAKDVVNLLRTMLETKRIFVNEELNAIIMRDSADKVRLAERIVLVHDRKPGEVMFEIEVLEVDKTKSDKFGVNFAKQLGAAVVPPGVTSLPTTPSLMDFTLTQLKSLGPSSFLFSLPSHIILDFLKTQSDAKTLANPKIRVVNNKTAKINIGDKVPILLSTTNTIPGAPGVVAPTTTTVTSIEYKDTGVKLTVEPAMHLNNDVTIKLQLEVTRLGDLITLQNNPLIQQFKFGTRIAETTLSLKDGESVVIGGLIQDEDRTTKENIPGLGEVPVLGWLFKHKTRDIVTTDVILTITPRIVRPLPLPGADEQTLWSGTEEAYSLKQLFSGIDAEKSTSMPSAETPAMPAAPPAGQPPAPQPPPSGGLSAAPAALSVLPGDRTVAVGQEVRLDVLSSHLEGLAGGTLTVSYDPKVLEFRQAVEGELLKRDGPAAVETAANPATGTVVVQLKRADAKGVSGAGVLATLAFTGKGAGSSPVTIQSSQLLNAAHAPLIAAAAAEGMVRVQ